MTQEINLQEFQELKKQEDSLVIDLQNQQDYIMQHIIGSVNISFIQNPSLQKFLPIILNETYKNIILLSDKKQEIEKAENILEQILKKAQFYSLYEGINIYQKNILEIEEMKQIESYDLVKQLNQEKYQKQVIDIWNPEEIINGHYSNAILMPLGTLDYNSKKLLDINKEYYVHCWLGPRSHIAYGLLRKNNFKVTNIIGGYLGMILNGFKLIKKQIKQILKDI